MVYTLLIYLTFVFAFGIGADIEDTNLLVPEIISKYGYPIEVHYVTTTDNYILCLHRIPFGKTNKYNKNRKEPIILQHGFLMSSADFIIAGPEKGLGYIMADAGYDVWLSNSRGNRYSKNHTHLDPQKDDRLFWNFSWHEIAIYDVPAIVDYVLNITKSKQLLHVGHSQGTTTYYVLNSEKPEYNKKFKAHISMAPVAFMQHVISLPYRVYAGLEYTLETFRSLFGSYEILPNNGFVNQFAKNYCNNDDLLAPVCSNILYMIMGYNPKQTNTSLIPIQAGHSPAGASIKQLLHSVQNVQGFTAKFRKYDYGFLRNLQLYQSIRPPSYILSNIISPVYLLYSENDWIAQPADVHTLASKLPNVKELFLIPDEDFNHLDFMVGIDAKILVYDKILEIVKNVSGN